MTELITAHVSPDVWGIMSPELYIAFWSLSLYDIMLPRQRYDAEIRKLKASFLCLTQF